MKKTLKTIFLSGPMRGIPRENARAWREKAKKILGKYFLVLDAYRGREQKETFPDPRLAVTRDKRDIMVSDIVLVNDTYKNASMIGTSMEILYAYQNNKVVIIFGEAHKGDYWMDNHSHARLQNLEDACELINRMFS